VILALQKYADELVVPCLIRQPTFRVVLIDQKLVSTKYKFAFFLYYTRINCNCDSCGSTCYRKFSGICF
jgi:hypothetical protein